MELEEHGDQNCNYSIQHECDLDEDVLSQSFLFDGLIRLVAVEHPLDRVKPGINHSKGYKVCDNENIDQQQDKELAIPEANTVVDPRTMMVHIKNTPIARRTMMASLWLENVTHQAVTTTLVLWITKMEAPKDWNLSWVSSHRLYE